MKPVKNFLFTIILVSAMAVSTIAGVQDTPGYVEPPPPPRQMAAYDQDTPLDYDTEQSGDISIETSSYLFFDVLTALISVY